MRNKGLQQWLCLEELPCVVGKEIVWLYMTGNPRWPAMRLYRSGMEIMESILFGATYSPSRVKEAYALFAEEVIIELSPEEAVAAVTAYEGKSRDMKVSMKNKLASAMTLANIEIEERETLRRARQLLTPRLVESGRALRKSSSQYACNLNEMIYS